MKALLPIIKKDLRRLRIPLALWGLLMASRLLLYHVIAGPGHVPYLEWVFRMSLGGDILLGNVINPLIAYFLVGSLVFADPLVERDAFWITRPISGGQLLAAKASGAFLMFVLFPVLVSLPWWIDCGLGAKGIALAAAHLGAGYLLLAAFGMACASVTDGFPRYLMWTVVGACVLASPYMNIPLGTVGANEIGFVGPHVFVTRVTVWALGIFILSVAAFCHQFVTRRLWSTVSIVVTGSAIICALCAVWRWDLTGSSDGGKDGSAGPEDAVSARLAGPSLYFAKNHVVRVPVAIEGAPANAAVKWMHVQAQWTIGPSLVWSSHGDFHDWRKDRMSTKALHSILGLPAAKPDSGAPAASVDVFIPFSDINAVRMKQEPAALRGQLDITLYYGTISGRLPARDASGRLNGRSYTLSGITVGSLDAKVSRHLGLYKGPTEGNYVTLGLTERSGSGFGLGPLISPPNVWPGPYILLVKPGSDRVCQAEVSAAGWVIAAQLDGVTVIHRNLVFAIPSTPGWLDDAELVVVSFGAEHTIHRSFDASPFEFTRADGNMTY
jgi:hypothetical protein